MVSRMAYVTLVLSLSLTLDKQRCALYSYASKTCSCIIV